ncbi:MAG: GTP pyrophosphokinase, partial [Silvibacterium sp.]
MATVRQHPPEDLPDASPLPSKAAPRSEQYAIDERFEALLRQVQANRAGDDVNLIRKAWAFCVQHHHGQMRASGEPYIIHPLEVAEVLA